MYSFGFILIRVRIWFWFVRIEHLHRIRSDLFGSKSRIESDWVGLIFKRFSTKDIWICFGLIRIGSDTDIGMIRNNSDRFGMNSYPRLIPGKRFKINPIQSDSIRDLYPNKSERIRSKFLIWMNQNRVENLFIRIDINPWPDLILICSDWKFTSNSFGLSRINFQIFFNKKDSKRFSDCFGLIRIDSDTDIGMIRNNSDWLGMNSYPGLFSGKRLKINPIQSETYIRMNPKKMFNPNESESYRTRIYLNRIYNPNQSEDWFLRSE